jgi:2-polyprenyl-6-methoxyphenol hydroxylase-like FAD-dependent oxidoreductase
VLSLASAWLLPAGRDRGTPGRVPVRPTGRAVNETDPVDATEVPLCIVGGGPAGLMLGLTMARAGVRVIVLEKHADFLRDFRGDTVQTSTLEVLDELGLYDRFEAMPHRKVTTLKVVSDAGEAVAADFSLLKGKFPYIAFAPQWDLLSLLADEARRCPTFEMRTRAEGIGVLRDDDGRVRGVRYTGPDGRLHDVFADLTVAADGRASTTRDAAGLVPTEFAAPMDVLWFRLTRLPTDADESRAQSKGGRLLALTNRGGHWQVAFVIPKDTEDDVRTRSIEDFRAEIARLLEPLADRVHEIEWENVKTLRVQVNRLEKWSIPGLLCIGDAAHAMSPVGGIGVNLAVQDAVATTNLLAEKLRTRTLTDSDVEKVQKRREFPAKALQKMQLTVQKRVLNPVLDGKTGINKTPPVPVKLVTNRTAVRRFQAKLLAYGVRPEHVGEQSRRPPIDARPYVKSDSQAPVPQTPPVPQQRYGPVGSAEMFGGPPR